jgi:hypothetical protein
VPEIDLHLIRTDLTSQYEKDLSSSTRNYAGLFHHSHRNEDCPKDQRVWTNLSRSLNSYSNIL